jgi:hypothetical protein
LKQTGKKEKRNLRKGRTRVFTTHPSREKEQEAAHREMVRQRAEELRRQREQAEQSTSSQAAPTAPTPAQTSEGWTNEIFAYLLSCTNNQNI